jgi:ABC-type transporter Mla subunit MlaD
VGRVADWWDAAMPEHRRPTVWIVLTCVFALAAVGLGIWAVNAQSDADDAKEQLTAQEQAAAEPEPTEAPTEAPTAAPDPTIDAETQQAIEDAKAQLGDVTDDVAQLQSELETAVANADEARQKAQDASGAADKLRAEAEAFKAQAALSATCLKGTLGALYQAYEAGGIEAATEQLTTLAGQCRNATTTN